MMGKSENVNLSLPLSAPSLIANHKKLQTTSQEHINTDLTSQGNRTRKCSIGLEIGPRSCGQPREGQLALT
jgi:hypothetical protein